MVRQPPTAPIEKNAHEPIDIADELDWDLDEAALSEPAAMHSMAQADDLDADDFGFEDDEPVTEAADEIEFDDDAFDAAFAKGIDAEALSVAPPAAREEDPLDALNRLTQRSVAPQPAPSWSRGTPVAQPQPFTAPAAPRPVAQPVAQAPIQAAPVQVPAYQPSYQPVEDELDDAEQSAADYDEMPDVETIDVPERVVALADDLDIPDLSFEDDQPTAQSYDDLDAEFSSLLNDMNAADAAGTRSSAYDDEPYDAGFKRGYEQDRAAQAYDDRRPVTAAASANYGADSFAGFAADHLPGSQPLAQADPFAVDELDYDPDLDQEMSVAGMAETARKPRRRGLFVAGIVGAVVIAGGLGAFALSGGKGTEAPVLVKADNAPIKVKPENPGGIVVPNQDNKVYDAVAKGAKPAAPVQEKLVTNTEVPMDVTAKQPQSRVVDLSPNDDDAADMTAGGNADTAPAPKSEDRIDQGLQQADGTTNPEVVAVAPRKVRTMVVKPDGSLVAREDPAPAASQVAAAEPQDPAPQHVAPAQDETGALQPAVDGNATGTPTPDAAPAATKPAETAKTATAKPQVKAKAQSSTTPSTVEVAPQRPSDQPVNIVGEVKPDQVASIEPSASAAGAGSWSMQIASQPSVDAAQSTYQDLQRRYSSVLGGRSASIVKAEIAGKGTFYRVRVPAQSRNDAINLCTSYKAAGGNCFVSK